MITRIALSFNHSLSQSLEMILDDQGLRSQLKDSELGLAWVKY